MDIKLVYKMFQELKAEMTINKLSGGEAGLEKVEKRQDELLDLIFEINRS